MPDLYRLVQMDLDQRYATMASPDTPMPSAAEFRLHTALRKVARYAEDLRDTPDCAHLGQTLIGYLADGLGIEHGQNFS